MKCKRCQQELRVTHTYSVAASAKTQSAKCTACGTRHTLLTISFEEPKAKPKKWGGGARAVNEELRRRLGNGEGFVYSGNGAEVRIAPTGKPSRHNPGGREGPLRAAL